MNIIEKKHLTVHDSVPYNQPKSSDHATITKDTAVGFAEWKDYNYCEALEKGTYKLYDRVRKLVVPKPIYTTSELYDIYVKSLEG